LASCCQRTPTIPLPSGRAAFDKLAARQRGAGHSLARPQTAPRSRIPRSLPTCASVPHAQLADAGSAIMPTPGNPRPVSASPRPVLGQSSANPRPILGQSLARPRRVLCPSSRPFSRQSWRQSWARTGQVGQGSQRRHPVLRMALEGRKALAQRQRSRSLTRL
jgi:hypothetical protein